MPELDNNIFGKRLKRFRLELGMTQTKLAKKINWHPCLVSMYERGTRMPSLEMAVNISKCLEVPIGFFVGEKPTEDYKGYFINRLTPENKLMINKLIRFLMLEENNEK